MRSGLTVKKAPVTWVEYFDLMDVNIHSTNFISHILVIYRPVSWFFQDILLERRHLRAQAQGMEIDRHWTGGSQAKRLEMPTIKSLMKRRLAIIVPELRTRIKGFCLELWISFPVPNGQRPRFYPTLTTVNYRISSHHFPRGKSKTAD